MTTGRRSTAGSSGRTPAPCGSGCCGTAAVEAGCPPPELFRVHVLALAGLVAGPEGVVRHKQIELPGHVTAAPRGRPPAVPPRPLWEADDHGRERTSRATWSTILFTEEQIQARLGELAAEIERDYDGQDILLVGVLRAP